MMKRETEFYEVEERKFKLNAIIVAVAIVTLLLTGTLFASKSGAGTTAMADIQTTEAYQAENVTE